MKLEARSEAIPEGGCVLWMGALNDKGYGGVWDEETKRLLLAHRLAYKLAHGDIPEGLLVCHRCDNRCCVNPHHMFLGTASDNSKDMHRKRRAPTVENKKQLTPEQVLEIFHSGGSHTETAKKYSCSPNAVSYIRRGVTHAGLTGAN